jgi:hypothetical protein
MIPALRAAKQRLEEMPGIARVHVAPVCCDGGMYVLYVGIEERGTPALRFDPPPSGPVRLPEEIVKAGAALDSARQSAVLRGDAAEDVTQGHSLVHDPAARAIQEKFIALAARYPERLRDVLRNSADAEHRALAAQVLAYSADKRSVVDNLVQAMRDSDDGVRNDAMRALALIALLAQRSPELRIQVPAQPFVDLLNSPIWTDRNKASMALWQLTESRDPALLASLRAQALSSLVEMTRWKGRGHAGAPFIVLGRVAGMPEDAIGAAWNRDDRQAVIDAAMKGTTRD